MMRRVQRNGPITTERLSHAISDRFDVVREIGRGRTATVFHAEEHVTARQVAIKVLRADAAAALSAPRFLRELSVVKQLDHPQVLSILECGEAGGVTYWITPLFDGESLRERLQRTSSISIDVAVLIAHDVARAVGHAHQFGVMHRNLTPEKIFVKGGDAVVTDFGVSRALAEARRDRGEGWARTSGKYLSPEQVRGAEVIDGRSDIFALGCILYEMLAGEPPPYGRRDLRPISYFDSVPSLKVLRQSTPHHIDLAVQKALAPDPADRFATTREFATALVTETDPPETQQRSGFLGHAARLVRRVLGGSGMAG